MKKGILRTLGVFVSLALMLAAFPASVAMAALFDVTVENIEGTSTTNPYWHLAKGEIGDNIQIYGNCPLTTTDIYFFFSSQEAEVGDSIGDSNDDVSVWSWLGTSNYNSLTGGYTSALTLEIPDVLDCDTHSTSDDEAVHDGLYYIYVCTYNTSTYTLSTIQAVTTFTVVGNSSIEIDRDEGAVGTEVTISGEGYAKSEFINILLDDDDITNDIDIIDGDDKTDNGGNFDITFEIPEITYGAHTISIVGEDSSAKNSVTFTVLPSITLSITSGGVGSTIIVNGTGFDRRNDIDIFIGGIQVDDDAQDRTDTSGSFSYSVVVPSTLGLGNCTVLVEDEDDDDIYATATFTIALNSILTLSNSSGQVGDSVTVTGTNFSPSTTLSILFDNTAVGTATTDAGGNFTSQVSIPAAVCGAHTIKIGSFGQTYTITPKITLDKTQGIAGTTVTITGTGFAASTAITATFNNSAVALSSSITNTTGGFVVTFTVPTAATGSYNVQVTAGSLASASFSIVDASLSLGASSGHVGDAVTVTGTNFAAGSSVSITFDGTVVATPTADASGGFTATFNVPTAAGGTHTVVASSGAISKSTTFTVTANVSVTPATGNVGTQVTLSGTGFNANANVTITYNGSALQSGTAMTTNAAGALTVSFQVPASPSGARTVAVSDGVNSASATFVMEATAPAAPTLTSPVNASQEKGIVTFDWSDVTDVSSPVTYRLQVATDSGFSTVVVNVAGLTESTYTLTDAEKLVKLADGGSYYWRVIASDAASNTSASSVNTFTVGGSMPSWLMWVWIGIGIVVVFIFAIWLGRRLAYSSY